MEELQKLYSIFQLLRPQYEKGLLEQFELLERYPNKFDLVYDLKEFEIRNVYGSMLEVKIDTQKNIAYIKIKIHEAKENHEVLGSPQMDGLKNRLTKYTRFLRYIDRCIEIPIEQIQRKAKELARQRRLQDM